MRHKLLGITGAGLIAAAGMSGLAPTAEPRRLRQSRSDSLAIEHVTVIPMDRDTALADQTILVSRDRIVWLGPARATPAFSGTRRIDGSGKFVIPGLADMHVHIERFEDLSKFVAGGVTTVRNMRGHPEHLLWRNQVARGDVVGPTILTTGPTCCHGLMRKEGFVRLRSSAQVDEEVRRQRRAGFDMVKVHSRLAPELYVRLLLTARAEHMPVVGHVIEGGRIVSIAGCRPGIDRTRRRCWMGRRRRCRRPRHRTSWRMGWNDCFRSQRSVWSS